MNLELAANLRRLGQLLAQGLALGACLLIEQLILFNLLDNAILSVLQLVVVLFDLLLVVAINNSTIVKLPFYICLFLVATSHCLFRVASTPLVFATMPNTGCQSRE